MQTGQGRRPDGEGEAVRVGASMQNSRSRAADQEADAVRMR